MNVGLTFLGILLFVTSVFMMMLILVQRGKGGGLTGALGGMGGQSAFGSKAGDVFTRITVITAIIWITLCMLTIAIYNPPPNSDSLNANRPASMSGMEDEEGAGGMGAGDSGASEFGAAGDSAGEAGSSTDSEEIPDNLDEEVSKILESNSSDAGESTDAGSSTEEPATDDDGN